MPGATHLDDPRFGNHLQSYDVGLIEDTAIAVDATYFIQQMLDRRPSHEPLLCALAGLTGIHMHMENELNQWKAHKVTPFFIFDGQPVVGQNETSAASGLRDIAKTNEAWDLYFKGQATEAVIAFGGTGCKTAFPPQRLYPLLQRLLKKRKLHFLVAPYNAASQIAYFDMIGSDQCGGIMGSLELLMYPIHDCVISMLDWNEKRVSAVSKRQLIRDLNVSEGMFIDAFLMTGTSFLPTFPPLRDETANPRPLSIVDALNMLRAGNKNVETVCSTFQDLLKDQEPKWLDKFQKARMAVDHFIFIDESGEVRVNEFDKLTGDNLEYLGFRLPDELFHYLDRGLVGPRVLSWVTYRKVNILPTLDGFVSEEYRNLVTKQLVPYYEAALTLMANRLNRAVNFQDFYLTVWYDNNFSLKLKHRDGDTGVVSRLSAWKMKEELFATHFPKAAHGTISFELDALRNGDFVAGVLQTPKAGIIDSADAIVSTTLWKLLTIRGYVDDKTLRPTKWGNALAATFAALVPVAKKHPEFSTLNAAALLAFELIRLGLLNSKNQHGELQGFPANGTLEDKNSVVLISRAATLLQLRQDTSGYTGPLSKNLLAFHSLTTTVADSMRALVESVLALSFMSNQVKRDRSDYWDIGHRLPYTEYPDAALGIAVKTFLDESYQDDTPEAKQERKKEFPPQYVPHATHLFDDFDVVFGLVDALHAGIQELGDSEMKAEDRAEWDQAAKYLARRK